MSEIREIEREDKKTWKREKERERERNTQLLRSQYESRSTQRKLEARLVRIAAMEFFDGFLSVFDAVD